MDITIHPGVLRGEIQIIPSKSIAHRYLICAALADRPTELICPEANEDIDATVDCLNALGANIQRTDMGFTVDPVSAISETAILNCRESGSTLRFMLPIVGALGVDATFLMAGRLPQRPLSPLLEEMQRMGCTLTRPTADTLHCTGRLHAGKYSIDGGVSSQFITGLLLALPLLDQPSTLAITGKAESQPYIDLTKAALCQFGVDPNRLGTGRYHSPGRLRIEGDWSNGALWLGAKYLGSFLRIQGLNPHSAQGDKVSDDLLRSIASSSWAPIVHAEDIPDLVPIMAVVAAANQGVVLHGIRRLRLKESDRVASVVEMIRNLGGTAEASEDTLRIHGTGLRGGIVDAHSDHRIAMAAAIAATVCREDVTILGAECVKKSYPKFWEEYARSGGNYELNIR
jgi:3-phosphoshikimate 1-carboxyvinyltransferase